MTWVILYIIGVLAHPIRFVKSLFGARRRSNAAEAARIARWEAAMDEHEAATARYLADEKPIVHTINVGHPLTEEEARKIHQRLADLYRTERKMYPR